MNSRAIAASILEKTLEEGGKSHELLQAAFRQNPGLDARERGFITALVHGTVGEALAMDFYLAQVSRTEIARLKPYLRGVLRMGLYQLLRMDRVPASAVVNESVSLVRKRYGEGLTGFANGVLRAAVRKTDWKAPQGAAAVSLPEALYTYLEALYGAEKALSIGRSYLEAPVLWGRVNESRIRPAEAASLLEADGYAAQAHPLFPFALRLERKRGEASLPLEQTRALREGLVQLQDLSAQLAVLAADPRPGGKVLDLCAAPGGKSLQAADLMRDSGEVIACDLTEAKCRLIRENIEKNGFSCLKARQADATAFEADFEGAFDLVIADLPCSGLGTASRKPEIKYRVTKEQIAELAELQRQILANAVRYVRPGGKLLYSTCTITKEENADNALYIENELGFKPVPLAERSEPDNTFEAYKAERPTPRKFCSGREAAEAGGREAAEAGGREAAEAAGREATEAPAAAGDGFFISLFTKEADA